MAEDARKLNDRVAQPRIKHNRSSLKNDEEAICSQFNRNSARSLCLEHHHNHSTDNRRAGRAILCWEQSSYVRFFISFAYRINEGCDHSPSSVPVFCLSFYFFLPSLTIRRRRRRRHYTPSLLQFLPCP